jgi:hypothetical protein
MYRFNNLICLMSISKAVCLGLLTVLGAGSIESAALAVSEPATLLLAQSSTVDLTNLFNVPNTVFLRDLTSEWRCMGITSVNDFGLSSIAFGALGGFSGTSYYTKGQSVLVGSENYLVVYSLINTTDKITIDTPLSLSLLSLKNTGTFGNIRRFDLAKETKVLEKQLTFLKRGLFGSSPSEEDAPSPVIKPAKKPKK